MSFFAERAAKGLCCALDFEAEAPCYPFGNSVSMYTDDNPWHVGVLKATDHPFIQSEIELLILMYGLVLQLKPQIVVETGCNIGLLTRALGYSCWVNGIGRVVSCDTDATMVERARQLCGGLPVEVRHCAALDLPELRIADLVFIDSSYESRSEEHKLIKSGAVYVYHDSFAEPWIRPELEYEKYKVHLDSPRGFSIVRKP